MSLRDLALQCEYRSDQTNTISDFYVPCFKESTAYWRAVGYFTSQGLLLAAKGLAEFLKHGGRMHLVASPWLEEEDVEALVKGYEAREEIVQRAILRPFDELAAVDISGLLRHRLECLAWLVAEERLEIKLALPLTKLLAGERGLYHEKVGLFFDQQGNTVAFTGSPNETIGGLVSNFESIDVFWSWDDPHQRIKRKVENFHRLWENQTPKLVVLNFPEAARERLIRLRPPIMPSIDMERGLEDVLRYISEDTEVDGYARSKPQARKALWPHQQAAIAAWEEHERIGLVSMATGSGKTLTALGAAERCPSLQLLVIAVPRTNLVEQWAEVVRENTQLPEPVLVHETYARWQERLFSRLRAATASGWQCPVVVIGTMRSLSGERFRSVITDAGMPPQSLVIVDEVHNAGAPMYREILDARYAWRLGLSATPARHFDEEGTSCLYAYFGKLVYVYDLKQALADGLLSPYEYYVYVAPLSDEEYRDYQSLTERIIRLRRARAATAVTFRTNNALDGDSEEVRQLLFRRASVLKKCTAKEGVINEILARHPLNRALVYCADTEQLEAVHGILNTHRIMHTRYVAETPARARRAALQAIEKGHVPCLLAIDCLDEGVDVPVVDMAVILASSTNKRQFVQRRGRILRRALGKKCATLIDVIAVPPASVGIEGRALLNGELARAKEMAETATNRYDALLRVKEYTARYGVLLTELLSGEGNG